MKFIEINTKQLRKKNCIISGARNKKKLCQETRSDDDMCCNVFFLRSNNKTNINRRIPISSRRLTHESHSIELLGTFERLPLFGSPSTVLLRERESARTPRVLVGVCMNACLYRCFVCLPKRMTYNIFTLSYMCTLIAYHTKNYIIVDANESDMTVYCVYVFLFICFNVQCSMCHIHLQRFHSIVFGGTSRSEYEGESERIQNWLYAVFFKHHDYDRC